MARTPAGTPAQGPKASRATVAIRSRPVVGILALQGDFAPHERMIVRLAAEARLVRRPEALEGLDRLILPGGESTVFVRLGERYGLLEALARSHARGLPLMGTCAGAILLARNEGHPPTLGAIDLRVVRNAYGRQRDSFIATYPMDFLGGPMECVFIRAPRLASPGPDVEVLARDGEDILVARNRNVLVATFHPELTDDSRLHEYFLSRF